MGDKALARNEKDQAEIVGRSLHRPDFSAGTDRSEGRSQLATSQESRVYSDNSSKTGAEIDDSLIRGDRVVIQNPWIYASELNSPNPFQQNVVGSMV